MLISNSGQTGAVLALLSVDLPVSFNIEPGVIDRETDVARRSYPQLDQEAWAYLGFIRTCQQKAQEIQALKSAVAPVVPLPVSISAPQPDPPAPAPAPVVSKDKK